MTSDIRGIRRVLGRQTICVAISLIILWLLFARVEAIDFTKCLAILAQFSPWQWGIAAVATMVSLGAVAQYDRLVAGQMGLFLPRKLAQYTAWRAVAISQLLGLGVFTGALVRWRLYGRATGMSLWTATKLTGFVGVTFLVASFAVTGFAQLLAMPLNLTIGVVWFCAASLLLIVLVLSLLGTSWRGIRIPNVRFLKGSLGWASLDLLAAAVVLFVFLPDGYVSFLIFAPAFMLAVNCGLMSSLPGGVGPFEGLLLTTLPQGPVEPLIAAVLAYRLIFFAAPALLASLALLNPPKEIETATSLPEKRRNMRAAPPEVILVGQDSLQFRDNAFGENAAMAAETQNTSIIFRDPFGAADPQNLIEDWHADNQTAGLGSCLYKVSGRTAAIARRCGFQAYALGQEALIDVKTFSLLGRSRRQLRRKMKQAERAGIEIRKGGLPFEIASKIDDAWQKTHGVPHGFSMGRLIRDLYRRETVFSAWHDGQAVAFITLMPGTQKTTLDLVRQRDGCPTGTIHALVVAAIEDATKQQVEIFSLASAPFHLDNPAQSNWARFCDSVYKWRAPLRGLYQFKNSFGPRWETEYACVDGSFAGFLAMFDLYRLIHTVPSNRESQEIHNDYALYEFASLSPIWHARLTPEFSAPTDPTAEMPCPPLQMP